MRQLSFMSLLVLIFLLEGCMNVATTSASAVYNRHSIQRHFNDQYATMRAYQALKFKSDKFNNANIAIATFNGEILLIGQVLEPWQKEEAERIVRKVTKAENIYNLVAIGGVSSTLTRMSDAWITAKIKTKLLASDDIDAGQIKVVTENGTVYLMGVVHPEEAKVAVELASETSGVENVVKLFSYITISKNLIS